LTSSILRERVNLLAAKHPLRVGPSLQQVSGEGRQPAENEAQGKLGLLQGYEGRDEQRQRVLSGWLVLITDDLGLIEEENETVVTLLQGGLDGLKQRVSEVSTPRATRRVIRQLKVAPGDPDSPRLFNRAAHRIAETFPARHPLARGTQGASDRRHDFGVCVVARLQFQEPFSPAHLRRNALEFV
jgi:hypothetical protein